MKYLLCLSLILCSISLFSDHFDERSLLMPKNYRPIFIEGETDVYFEIEKRYLSKCAEHSYFYDMYMKNPCEDYRDQLTYNTGEINAYLWVLEFLNPNHMYTNQLGR